MRTLQKSQSQRSFPRLLLRSLYRVFMGMCALAAAAGLCLGYAFFIEPHWVRVKRVRLAEHPTVRVIHITDIHYKGDRAYLEKVVREINGIDADAVCFTGDLIEGSSFLPGALEGLSKLNKPLYGVEGNHDRWALRTFRACEAGFRATGGDWLITKPALIPARRLALVPIGAAKVPTPPGYKRVILDHYPTDVKRLEKGSFDVMLAGHTHGGQTGLPFLFKALHITDFGPYVRGLYQTSKGPLYVNPGIGTFHISARFLCRPEIAVIEL